MSDTEREIQELLADYAEALRDGSIPAFLKSLRRSRCGPFYITGRCQDRLATEKGPRLVQGRTQHPKTGHKSEKD